MISDSVTIIQDDHPQASSLFSSLHRVLTNRCRSASVIRQRSVSYLPFLHMFSLVRRSLFCLGFLLNDADWIAIVLGVFAHYSDKIKMRSPFVLAGLVMCLIGFSINISEAPSGVKYFGTFFCVAGSYAAFPGVVAWSVPTSFPTCIPVLIVFLGWEIISLGSINVESGWPSISVLETSAVLLPAIFIEPKTLRDSSSDVSYEFLPTENISPCRQMVANLCLWV